jgi:pSer/pThr/pTyr-binding forkhead associated (FHA) protein
MPTLCLMGEDGSTVERIALAEEPVVVGRSELADVKIDDDALSRQHFLVVREGQRYILQDLNSSNGTCIAGRRVLAAKLRHNDCILAGRTVFLFKEIRAASTRFEPASAVRQSAPAG